MQDSKSQGRESFKRLFRSQNEHQKALQNHVEAFKVLDKAITSLIGKTAKLEVTADHQGRRQKELGDIQKQMQNQIYKCHSWIFFAFIANFVITCVAFALVSHIFK
jgi:hypothetical protein